MPQVSSSGSKLSVEKGMDFHRPALGHDDRPHVPEAVPAFIEAAPALDQAIPQQADRVGFEEIAGAIVSEGGDDPHEAVISAQPGVALQLIGENAVGVGIKQHGADVQGLVVIEHADFGGLTRLAAFHRLLLAELRDGRGQGPDIFVKVPVQLHLALRRHAGGLHGGAHIGGGDGGLGNAGR